jgi:predicted aspartyl protease
MPKSFTIEYNGLVSSLNTPCGICKAVDLSEPASSNDTQIVQFHALWDTGAEGSVISERAAKALGLEPTGKARVYHADGESIVNTYSVNIFLPNDTAFYVPMVTEGNLTGTDVLIGMNIISMGDFAVTAYRGKTKLSFQIPSTHDTDYVKEHEQNTRMHYVKETTPGRNAPCSCDSGKKYKHCCGK